MSNRYTIRKSGEDPEFPWTFEGDGGDTGSSRTWEGALAVVLLALGMTSFS